MNENFNEVLRCESRVLIAQNFLSLHWNVQVGHQVKKEDGNQYRHNVFIRVDVCTLGIRMPEKTFTIRAPKMPICKQSARPHKLS